MASLENMTAAIIDDTPDEVAELVKVLNRAKISTAYFEPSADIPTLMHVRFVFLDLKLVSAVSEDPEDLAKGAAQYLGKLLDKDKNGPYILFLWTKHEEKDSGLMTYLSPTPVAIVKMNKIKFMALQTDAEKIKHVADKLDEALRESPFAKIILDLECSAKGASAAALATIVPEGCSKDNDIGINLHMLKKAAIGEQSGNEDVKIIKSVFSRLISDFMEMGDSCSGSLPNVVLPAVPQTEPERGEFLAKNNKLKAKLHTSLHLDTAPAMCMPGNIYKYSGEPLSWVKESIDDPKQAEMKDKWLALEQVWLEVSPVCEWSNGKQHNHRLLRGLIFLADQKPKPKRDLYLYQTPRLLLDGKEILFLFDLRCLETVKNGSFQSVPPICRLRTEILSDIQSKLGGCLARLGVTSAE